MAAPAAPVFPPNRGGGGDAGGAGGYFELLPDPSKANPSDIMKAHAILQMRTLHVAELQAALAGGVATPAMNAMMAANAEDALRLAVASEYTLSREKATRAPKPLTLIPERDYGNVADISNIRLHTVKSFYGNESDNREVFRWINRVLGLGRTYKLTLEATMSLLSNSCAGEAADYVGELIAEGEDFAGVIRNLELRYGDLCHPEAAVTKCHEMKRLPDETLPSFADRIRFMGKMAYRMVEDKERRAQSIDALVELNVVRVADRRSRPVLEERILSRRRSGLPPFTSRELEREMHEIERRGREERAEAQLFREQNQVKGKHYGRGYVRECREASPSPPRVLYSSKNELQEESEDSDVGEVIAYIKKTANRYAERGKRFDKQKLLDKANVKFQRDPQPAVGRKNAAAAAAVQEIVRGPPLRFQEGQQRPSIPELMAKANCDRSECLHCGNQGHFMKREGCPLLGKPLMDRACPVCKKGLHGADDCIRVFQKRAGGIQSAETDDSDLND